MSEPEAQLPPEETRGGEEAYDWKVAIEALQHALNTRPEERTE